MKRLIMVGGPMGVGKTSTCRALQRMLPGNVFLDGDWCWDARPFVVTEETRRMVVENIAFLLNRFLACSAYESVLFCWVMNRPEIAEAILSRLPLEGVELWRFSLMADANALARRIQRDIAAGLRAGDALARSLTYLETFDAAGTEKIDTSRIDAEQAAAHILERVGICRTSDLASGRTQCPEGSGFEDFRCGIQHKSKLESERRKTSAR